MVIGVPKEIKTAEYRVGMTPYGVEELAAEGHPLLIETSAGEGSGFPDDQYRASGGEITSREEVFSEAHLIVKVKEPMPSEYDMFREGQSLFTFLHLAPNTKLIDALLKRRVTGMGYETLEKNDSLPLLAPMSEIAGRMAPLMGAYFLQKPKGGTGVLPTGVLGVEPAKAVILGAGVVGMNAARDCAGLGMDTTILDIKMEKLRRVDEMFMGRVKTLPAMRHNLKEEVKEADIVIGAVLVPGGKAPVLITRDMLKTMKKGAVIVDVAIDQGGCFETSRPTTHDAPVYEVEGVLHYTVANMPGAYPKTSTFALTNVTLPYIKMMASLGVENAIRQDDAVRSSVNTYGGFIVHRVLAESTGYPYRDLHELLPDGE